jgi:hypothetical protein
MHSHSMVSVPAIGAMAPYHSAIVLGHCDLHEGKSRTRASKLWGLEGGRTGSMYFIWLHHGWKHVVSN